MAKDRKNYTPPLHKQNGHLGSSAHISELIARAHNALMSGELEKAESLAKELIELEVGDGYDILAMVCVGSDRIDEAIGILEEATKKYPEDVELWVGLANCLSEAERYEDALHAYMKAMDCPDAEIDVIELNEAVVYARMGEIAKATEICERIRLNNEEFANHAISVLLSIYYDASLFQKIIDFAEKNTKILKAHKHQYWDESLSVVYFSIAAAYWAVVGDKKKVMPYLKKAIQYNRTNPEVLDLVREINNLEADKAKEFSITAEGAYFDADEDKEVFFVAEYFVVAESIEEANKFIREHEPECVRKLEIKEYTTKPLSDEEELRGIVNASDLYFIFDDDDDDDMEEED